MEVICTVCNHYSRTAEEAERHAETAEHIAAEEADMVAVWLSDRNDTARKIAEQMYANLYDDLDDKNHKAETVQEIYEWLLNGDQEAAKQTTISELVSEWIEYTSDERTS